jgi:hypothetical protein
VTAAVALQEHLAKAALSRLASMQTDFIRSTTLGSLAELTAVLGARISPWAEDIGAAALREMSGKSSHNRHHGVFALGILVRNPHLECCCGGAPW